MTGVGLLDSIHGEATNGIDDKYLLGLKVMIDYVSFLGVMGTTNGKRHVG
jgi:hypothetical protein